MRVSQRQYTRPQTLPLSLSRACARTILKVTSAASQNSKHVQIEEEEEEEEEFIQNRTRAGRDS